jgi:glycosyltransferase involved in cell wall biosynthesis
VSRPLVSVAIYTRNRPGLLQRVLGSILGAAGPVADQVEVAVSDGSDDDTAGEVVHKLMSGWPGGYQYVRNVPPLDIVENMNKAAEISTGEWVQLLGDDDYLLPGAGAAMVRAAGKAPAGEPVLLFGVTIVDADGLRRRDQPVRRGRYLSPEAALRRLLSNSAFVREPAVLMRRSALEQAGMFNTKAGLSPDTDMWVRLMSRHGVRLVPLATVALTIHEGAATTGMWNADSIRHLQDIFDLAIDTGVVHERQVRRWQADFFHQFILAGAYRRLKTGRRADAGQILRLFDLPEVRRLGTSLKWLPVRTVFNAATAGTRPIKEFSALDEGNQPE